LLGDFSRATWAAAAAAAALLLALVAALAARAGAGAPPAWLAALVWGVAIGAGGVIAWLGALVALAVERFLRPADARSAIALSAGAGALAMLVADTLPRALVGGYAPPVGVSVAMVAVPWAVAFGARRERPASGALARGLRALDFAVAGASFLAFAGAAALLTFIVSILG
jgi:hypothetical protein